MPKIQTFIKSKGYKNIPRMSAALMVWTPQTALLLVFLRRMRTPHTRALRPIADASEGASRHLLCEVVCKALVSQKASCGRTSHQC